jgi:hypothetical protein
MKWLKEVDSWVEASRLLTLLSLIISRLGPAAYKGFLPQLDLYNRAGFRIDFPPPASHSDKTRIPAAG